MPALLQRKSRRDSAARNFWTAGVMVRRSEKSTDRKSRRPLDDEWVTRRVEIAAWQRASERPAM